MPEVKEKFASFTVSVSDKNALIPLDELDVGRTFEANVVTNQGYLGTITRTSGCTRQKDGKYEFTVDITYLEGPKRGRKKKATVKNYTPSGRYGELFR